MGEKIINEIDKAKIAYLEAMEGARFSNFQFYISGGQSTVYTCEDLMGKKTCCKIITLFYC